MPETVECAFLYGFDLYFQGFFLVSYLPSLNFTYSSVCLENTSVPVVVLAARNSDLRCVKNIARTF